MAIPSKLTSVSVRKCYSVVHIGFKKSKLPILDGMPANLEYLLFDYAREASEKGGEE